MKKNNILRRFHTMGQQKLSKEQELKLVEEYRAGASVN